MVNNSALPGSLFRNWTITITLSKEDIAREGFSDIGIIFLTVRNVLAIHVPTNFEKISISVFRHEFF